MRTGRTKIVIALVTAAVGLAAVWFYGCGKTEIVAPPLSTTTTAGPTTTTLAPTTTTTTSASTSSTDTTTSTATTTTSSTIPTPLFGTETIEAGPDVGYYTSLALDSGGKAHVFYYSSREVGISTNDLKYATNKSGGWTDYSVDTGGVDVGYYASVARDPSDNLHVSYYNKNYGNLKYNKVYSNQTWLASTTIESAGDVGQYTSIATDGNYIHIAYYDVTNKSLKYAKRLVAVGGVWTTSTVEQTAGFDHGKYCSIALDAAGNPRIGYYSTNIATAAGCLKYASYDPVFSIWQITTLDSSAANVGLYTSLAFDGNGKGHLSYYDQTNGDLKYTTDSAGGWTSTTVETTENTGLYTSIKVDGNDRPHISYYTQTYGNLKYARNLGSSWEAFIVDQSGDVGQYTSIALDGSDKPHFSYYDLTNKSLKYAKQTN